MYSAQGYYTIVPKQLEPNMEGGNDFDGTCHRGLFLIYPNKDTLLDFYFTLFLSLSLCLYLSHSLSLPISLSLSLYLSLSIYLSISLSGVNPTFEMDGKMGELGEFMVRIALHLAFFLFVHLTVYLPAWPCFCLSISLACLFVHFSILFVCLLIYVPACPSVWLCLYIAHIFVCLSILFIW